MAAEILVRGVPAPQGSKNPRPIYRGRGPTRVFTGKVALEESSQAVAPWRAAVRDAFEKQWRWSLITGPVRITRCVFVLTRPSTHYFTGRNAHRLRDDAPAYPIAKQRNDIDKLLRSTLDGITSAGVIGKIRQVGIVWVDDSQVIGVDMLRKVYQDHPLAAPLAGQSGAIIRVEAVSEPMLEQPPLRDRLLTEIGF
jgi:Holliday junction resolvase RusA-like endonuclease